MNDYYQLESLLLAVQTRHHGFFEQHGTPIIDYVTIEAIGEDIYGLKTLRDLPRNIRNDLDAGLSGRA